MKIRMDRKYLYSYRDLWKFKVYILWSFPMMSLKLSQQASLLYFQSIYALT